MTVLSKHFTLEQLTRSQTAARKGLDNTPPDWAIENLAQLCSQVLDLIVEQSACGLSVSSGYRSFELNAAIGGSRNSQHCLGEAADIHSECLDTGELFQFIRNSKIPFDQLIFEGSWVHVSFTHRHALRGEVLKAFFEHGGVRYVRL